MAIVGYLLWRRDRKGVPRPSKLLKDHRDWALQSPNHQDNEHYRYGLVKEVPLDDELWALSLDELVQRFPSGDGT